MTPNAFALGNSRNLELGTSSVKLTMKAPMKVLVFAHVPPPHHGQSYMVKLMLEGFGGDRRKRQYRDAPSPRGMECYHVNARLSKRLEDIGDLRLGKFVLLLGYCIQAIWCHFRYGIENLYYIPAPGKKSALYRDWVVMLLCRPFFKRVILHWEAAGLAKWLETSVQIRTRSLTFRLMKYVDVSVILSKYTRADAEKIFSKTIRVVNNGVPDPCPDFERSLLPRRRERLASRLKCLSEDNVVGRSCRSGGEVGNGSNVSNVLYVAHCSRDKGLFDAIEGVLLANRQLKAKQSAVSMRLMIAGVFVTEPERAEFDAIMATPAAKEAIHYLGFVEGEKKTTAFRDADAFCFPTYYHNESQPVSLIEAMAFGLPVVTTGWRSIPELLPADYFGLVPIRTPEKVAEKLLQALTSDTGEELRRIFLQRFTVENYLSGLADAFHSIEYVDANPVSNPAPKPIS